MRRFTKLKLPKLTSSSIRNLLWLFGDHLITFVGGLLVSVWLAKHIGPKAFGVYGFALSIFTIASSFAQLGMGGVAIKEMVQTQKIGTSIGTVFSVKLLGSVLSVIGLFLYLSYNDITGDSYWMTLVVSIGLFYTPFSTIDNYFDSIVQSKWKVLSRKFAFLVKILLVILFILNDWPFLYLAYILLLEYTIGTISSIWAYFTKGPTASLGVDLRLAKKMLLESWPLVISGLGAILYLKMDQVMVVSMVSETDGGYYNAAVKYSTIFYFLHTIILTTFFPTLVESRRTDMQKYYDGTKKIFSLLFYLSLVVILGTFFFIDSAIYLSFGEEYLPSVSIILIHIFTLPLVYIGGVLSKWLIIEKLTKYSLVRHSLGFGSNLALNLILIPKYGAIGAALASVIALFFSCFVILFFHSRLRDLLALFFKSLFYPIQYLRGV